MKILLHLEATQFISMELIFAIRADDEEEVQRLLQGNDVDVNARTVVEGTKVCCVRN